MFEPKDKSKAYYERKPKRRPSRTIINQNDINRLKSEVDIVAVVMSYTPLRACKNGDYLGKCLICKTSKSNTHFRVSHRLQIYKCFNCGTSGNVFTYVKAVAKVGFDEAFKIVMESHPQGFEYESKPKPRIRWGWHFQFAAKLRQRIRLFKETRMLKAKCSDEDLPF